MKKLISMLLALTLVLALVPTVFADDATFTWTFVDGTLTMAVANGGDYNATTDIRRLWPGIGGKGNTNKTTARHNDNAYEQRIAFPSEIKADEGKAIISFSIQREIDSIICMKPLVTDQDTRQNYVAGFDIDLDGNVKLLGTDEGAGTIVANIGVMEYHDFDLIYTPSSEGLEFEFYIDGRYFGPYYSTQAFAKKGIYAFQIWMTGNSRVGRAIGSTRADGRPEYVYLKNFVVTNDESTLPSDDLCFASVKNISDNEILFTANKEITAPAVEDVTIDGAVVSSVAQNDTHSFVVTVEDNGHACAKDEDHKAQSYEIGKTYTYTVALEGKTLTGSYVEKHQGSVDKFDDGKWPTWLANTSYPAGSQMSTQWTRTSGDVGYNGDGAFAWSPNQGKGYSTSITYNHKLAPIIWLSTVNGVNGTINNDSFVVSVDFQRGSERVGGYPLSLGWSNTNGGQPQSTFPIMLDAATGVLSVKGTTIDEYVEAGVWHNVTLHVTLSTRGSGVAVYYDGVKKGEFNMGNTSGIWSIRSHAASLQPEDESIAALNCTDPGRWDVMCFDNFYIGRDFNYITSDIVLSEKADGSAANASWVGLHNRKNPVVSALYDSTGALKEIKTGLIWKNAFLGTSWPGAFTFDSAVAGDTIKVFAVYDLINLRPISNVITKTVE